MFAYGAPRLVGNGPCKPGNALVRGTGRASRRGSECKRVRRIGEPVEPLRERLRCVDESSQPLAEGDERARQVPAVHRGHVTRAQRRKCRRVVPVQEMSLMAFEAFERRQRSIDAGGERVRREITQIVRGQRREQPHRDVRR